MKEHTGMFRQAIARKGFVPPAAAQRGFSLVEVMIVLTVLAILVAIAVPSYTRAVEQSRADVAVADLRAIWAAQRIYWLEQRVYSADLPSLESIGLLDPTLLQGPSGYAYAVSEADAGTFTASATRTGSSVFSGQFTIDATGAIAGSVVAAGQPDILPGFQ
jgi:type IV pilus assembly protein PilE